MLRQPDASITRIRSAQGKVVGAGFLIDVRQVLTCAHVVAAALNLADAPPELPQGMMELDFPLVAPGEWLAARVVPPWQPADDIAVLEFESDVTPPSDAQIIRLANTGDDLWAHEFRAFGFPVGQDDGVTATGRILGKQARGWLQIEDPKETGRRVEPGFSGTPVWDEQLDSAIGMVVASDRYAEAKTAFVIPVETLAKTWPRLEDLTLRFVFVSYSRKDGEFVMRLHTYLQAHGISLWVDRVGLTPGTYDWEEAIRKAIRSSRSVLLVASPNARSSRYVRDELRIADMYSRRVFPVWAAGDDDRWMDCIPLGWGSVQAIDARDARYDEALEKIVATLGKPSQVTPPPPPEPAQVVEISTFAPRNPYKGLRPFTDNDVPDFFGRERLTDALLKAFKATLDTKGPRLLPVIGASGSGKSSVIMAGVLPRLRHGALPGSEKWIYSKRVVPGKDPLENLALALSSASGGYSIADMRRDLNDPDARGLHLRARQLVDQADGRLVLFIDQFEELFTLTTDENLRNQFVNLLETAIREPEGPTIVVLTLRADFYDRPMDYPSMITFAQLLEKHHQVLPMTGDELRDAITKPAQNVGITLDDDLVGDLLFELRDRIGGLPLLEFTLDQLFERREGRRLKVDTYRAIGGVRGALTKHAEEAYTGLTSEEHKKLARALFLRLVEPGVTEQDTATRRRAALSELTLRDPVQAEVMRNVYDTFVEARLLTTDRIGSEETVEVSHEALIREWGRFREWVKQARGDLHLQKKISEATTEWIARARGADLLYHGQMLQDARDWAAHNVPSADEREFIEASSAHEAELKALEDQRKRELNEAKEQAERARQEAQQATAEARTAQQGAKHATEESQHSAEAAQAAQQRAKRARRLAIGFGLTMAVVAVAAAVFTVTSLSVARQARNDAASAQAQVDQAQVRLQQLDGYRSLSLASTAEEALRAGDRATAVRLALDANNMAAPPAKAQTILARAAYTPGLIRRFKPADALINDVAFSPDGNLAASGGQDPALHLWKVATGEQVGVFEGHTAEVLSVDFSPDGRYIVSGAADQTLRLWNVSTGEQVRVFKGHTARVLSVNFSPDGRYLVSGAEDRSLRLWDVATGETIQVFSGHEKEVTSVKFSADGKSVISGSADNTLRLWDVKTGQPEQTFTGHQGPVNSVDFSPDGSLVLSGSADDTVRLWDVKTGQETQRFSGHTQPVSSVMFSANGAYVLSGSFDGTVRLWGVKTGEQLLDMKGHADAVTRVVFSPDSLTALSGSYDKTLCLWSLTSGAILRHLEGHTGWVNTAAFNPVNRTVLSGAEDGRLILWDVDEASPTFGQPLQTLSGHIGQIRAVKFSADGQMALTGADDKLLILWNMTTFQEVQRLQGHTDAVASLTLSPDGRQALSGSINGELILWDLKTFQELHRFEGYTDGVYGIAFSPDGSKILAGDTLGKAVLWDSKTYKAIREYSGLQMGQQVSSVAFSHDGHTALIGGGRLSPTGEPEPGIMILWDVDTGAELRRFVGHTNQVSSVSFSADDRTALSGSLDSTLRLWDVKTGDETRRFEGQGSWVLSAAFSADERRIVSAGCGILSQSDFVCLKSALILWRVDTLQELEKWAREHSDMGG